MKKGYEGLEALAREITKRAEAKVDLVANTGNIAMHNYPSDGVMLTVGDREFKVADTAHRQLQGHLKIPADYYDRMLQEEPGLLAQNVNTWLHKNKENRLVRTLFGSTRAFLSDRYRPLENEDLAQAVLPVLIERKLSVMSCSITDRRMYIKAVDETVERALHNAGARFGDGGHKIVKVVAPAITISNSEIGEGAVSVLGGVFERWCSNLGTFGERSTRKYHVGGKHELAGEETYALLSDETRKKTDEAVWAQISDVVAAAFDQAKFDALCDKIDDTAKDKIEGDVVKVVSFATKKFGLNETEGKSVLEHLIKGGDLSRLGLYDAVTRASADVESYDRASELERIGGAIIELPRNQWQELAAAA